MDKRVRFSESNTIILPDKMPYKSYSKTSRNEFNYGQKSLTLPSMYNLTNTRHSQSNSRFFDDNKPSNSTASTYLRSSTTGKVILGNPLLNSTPLYNRLSRLNLSGKGSAGALGGGSSVILNGYNLGNIRTPSITNRLQSVPYSSNSYSEMKKRNSLGKQHPYFLPSLIDPRTLANIRSSAVNRLAHSDSNISVSTTSTGLPVIPSRKPTTIHVKRQEPFIHRKNSKSVTFLGAQTRQSSPRKKSWKKEIILANYTTMNPNANELDSLSMAQLEKRIDEKSSLLFPSRATSRENNNNLLKNNIQNYTSNSRMKLAQSSTTGVITSPRRGHSMRGIRGRAQTSVTEVENGSSSRKVSFEASNRTPSNSKSYLNPSSINTSVRDLPTKIYKKLRNIGLEDKFPQNPVSGKTETLSRLRKAYSILQKELETLNINEEAVLKARGFNFQEFEAGLKRNVQTARNIHIISPSRHVMMKKVKPTEMRSKRKKTPFQELCDGFKGPSIDQSLRFKKFPNQEPKITMGPTSKYVGKGSQTKTNWTGEKCFKNYNRKNGWAEDNNSDSRSSIISSAYSSKSNDSYSSHYVQRMMTSEEYRKHLDKKIFTRPNLRPKTYFR